MLKTKLAYMALGAVIASIGFFIGTLNNLNAEDEVAHVKKLIVSEEIQVGSADGARAVYTLITPGKIKTTWWLPKRKSNMVNTRYNQCFWCAHSPGRASF